MINRFSRLAVASLLLSAFALPAALYAATPTVTNFPGVIAIQNVDSAGDTTFVSAFNGTAFPVGSAYYIDIGRVLLPNDESFDPKSGLLQGDGSVVFVIPNSNGITAALGKNGIITLAGGAVDGITIDRNGAIHSLFASNGLIGKRSSDNLFYDAKGNWIDFGPKPTFSLTGNRVSSQVSLDVTALLNQIAANATATANGQTPAGTTGVTGLTGPLSDQIAQLQQIAAQQQQQIQAQQQALLQQRLQAQQIPGRSSGGGGGSSGGAGGGLQQLLPLLASTFQRFFGGGSSGNGLLGGSNGGSSSGCSTCGNGGGSVQTRPTIPGVTYTQTGEVVLTPDKNGNITGQQYQAYLDSIKGQNTLNPNLASQTVVLNGSRVNVINENVATQIPSNIKTTDGQPVNLPSGSQYDVSKEQVTLKDGTVIQNVREPDEVAGGALVYDISSDKRAVIQQDGSVTILNGSDETVSVINKNGIIFDGQGNPVSPAGDNAANIPFVSSVAPASQSSLDSNPFSPINGQQSAFDTVYVNPPAGSGICTGPNCGNNSVSFQTSLTTLGSPTVSEPAFIKDFDHSVSTSAGEDAGHAGFGFGSESRSNYPDVPGYSVQPCPACNGGKGGFNYQKNGINYQPREMANANLITKPGAKGEEGSAGESGAAGLPEGTEVKADGTFETPTGETGTIVDGSVYYDNLYTGQSVETGAYSLGSDWETLTNLPTYSNPSVAVPSPFSSDIDYSQLDAGYSYTGTDYNAYDAGYSNSFGAFDGYVPNTPSYDYGSYNDSYNYNSNAGYDWSADYSNQSYSGGGGGYYDGGGDFGF